MRLDEVVAAVPNVTARQVDHWARRGYLPTARSRPGSGRRREYDVADVRVIRALAAVSAALGELPRSDDAVHAIAWAAEMDVPYAMLPGGVSVRWREVL